ncbi:MAG: calcium/sodium antiporter [Gemmatimonadetes bacterium]|nr:calcium/sodium antiporter [Gemmatimonadota bacterium]
MSPSVVLLFVAGLVLLTVGAEGLVRGATRLAAAAGIPPLVVGLTVVAYGTSAPEVAVSVRSAFGGQAALALGNVVGSNVFNVLFILGLSAIVSPLLVQRQLVRLDVPFMIGVSFLPVLLGLDGTIGRWDGVFLVVLAVAYTILLLRMGRAEPMDGTVVPEGTLLATTVKSLLFLLGGLALLVVGAEWLVEGAVIFARSLGVSDVVVGLTVIAAGTSLPELATSVVASLRGQRDIAVGNVVGSNVFNILAVLGITSAVAPEGIPVPTGVLTFDLPVMVAVALACLPIFFTGWRIERWEGAVFLAYYVIYIAALVLDATDHPGHALFGTAVLGFVIPLTLLTAVGIWWRERKER